MLTQERLKELLHYDPDTGLFTWRKPTNRRLKVGSIAGTLQSPGRRYIRVDGKLYKASRLAFLYMTGKWPKAEVDHRDLDKANDRWNNLRDATRQQNQSNQPVRKNNRLGVKGVSRNGNGFMATITVNRERIYLGTYATLTEAAAIRVRAARDLHGEFARQ